MDTDTTPQDPQPRPAGPFGTPDLDPLVFTKSDDAPETRAAAAMLGRTQVIVPRPEVTPLLVETDTDYHPWTPGPAVAGGSGSLADAAADKVRRVVSLIAILAPLVLLAGAIWVGVIISGNL